MDINNLSLYEIGQEYQNLLYSLYDEETGEVDEVAEAKLNELAPSVEKKCVAVASWIRRLEAENREIEYLKEEVLKREKLLNKYIKKFKSYLKDNMERLDIKKINCALFTIKIKKNRNSVEIIDESEIPKEYLVKKETIKFVPDKDKIKRDIMSGKEVPGAKLEQKTKLEISINQL